MNSAVMKALTGDTSCKLKNETDLISEKPSSYTATFTGVNKVYNLFPGKVLFLGYYKGLGTITIQVSPYEIIRYCNVKGMQVWYGTSVLTGHFLGLADPHKGLQLEYCTSGSDTSRFPIRINETQYYKQNPINILEGLYEPEQRLEVTEAFTRSMAQADFTYDQIMEWGIPEDSESSNKTITVNNLKDIPLSVKYMLSPENRGED